MIDIQCYGNDAKEMQWVSKLIDDELSEPYSVFTYRYFMGGWPQLTFLAVDPEDTASRCVGVIVCKFDEEKRSGYIAMLAVRRSHRRQGLGRRLVQAAVQAMIEHYEERGIEEIVLEAEITNNSAVGLYENLGFVKERHLHKYYMNGSDAYRLKLWLSAPPGGDFDLLDEYTHN